MAVVLRRNRSAASPGACFLIAVLFTLALLLTAPVALAAPTEPSPENFYEAIVLDCYDGDTCTLDIDLGFDVWLRDQRTRLNRIDSPEMRGAERAAGVKSRDWLRKRISGKSVVIEGIEAKEDKYNRWVVEIWQCSASECRNINDAEVKAGLAAYRTY